MNTTIAGFSYSVKQENTSGSYANQEYFQPLLGDLPSLEDVGINVNGRFYPISLETPTTKSQQIKVEVPVTNPPYRKELATRVEKPWIYNSLGQCATDAIFTCTDLPLEGSDSFDDTWLDDENYVKNYGISKIYSMTHNEYDESSFEVDDGVEYRYVITDETPSYVSYPKPETLNYAASGEDSNAASVGVKWDNTEFMPDTKAYMYLRAACDNRLISEIAQYEIKKKVAYLDISYDEDTGTIAITNPNSDSNTIYLNGDLYNADDVELTIGVSYYETVQATNTLEVTLPTTYDLTGTTYDVERAELTIKAYITDQLTEADEFAFTIILKNDDTIESETYTESFTKRCWSTFPDMPGSGTQTVGINLERPKPDFYATPDGTGTGLTPSSPCTLESALASGGTIWCTTGTYGDEDTSFDVDISTHLVGGFDAAFTKRSGVSTFAGACTNEGVVEYFQVTELDLLNKPSSFPTSTQKTGSWKHCAIDVTASPGGTHNIIQAAKLIDCDITVGCSGTADTYVSTGLYLLVSDKTNNCRINVNTSFKVTCEFGECINSTIELAGGSSKLSSAGLAVIDGKGVVCTDTIFINCSTTISCHNAGNGYDGTDGSTWLGWYDDNNEYQQVAWDGVTDPNTYSQYIIDVWGEGGTLGGFGDYCVCTFTDCLVAGGTFAVTLDKAGDGGNGGANGIYCDIDAWNLTIANGFADNSAAGRYGASNTLTIPEDIRDCTLTIIDGGGGTGGSGGTNNWPDVASAGADGSDGATNFTGTKYHCRVTVDESTTSYDQEVLNSHTNEDYDENASYGDDGYYQEWGSFWERLDKPSY